jgi:hypothetical protein
MKTLTEIEPRIAINAVNTPGDSISIFRINQPGSYYLTGNLTGVSGKHGILIAASGVSIDLNGFRLTGVGGSYSGITASNETSITGASISHGSIASWSSNGIDFNLCPASKVTGITAENNTYWGLLMSDSSVVADCIVRNNGANNIEMGPDGRISRCTSTGSTGGSGISLGKNGVLSDCVADSNINDGVLAFANCSISRVTATKNHSNGLNLGEGCTASDSVASSNYQNNINCNTNCSLVHCTALRSVTGFGIDVQNGGTITNCVSRLNQLSGIVGFTGCSITNCSSSENLGSGFYTGDGSVIVGCSSYKNGQTGIDVSFAAVAVTDCSASSNSGHGIDLGNGGVATHCVASSNGLSGFNTSDSVSIYNCSSFFNTADGITTAYSCNIVDCTASGNKAWGITASKFCRVTGCYVYANTAPAGGGIRLIQNQGFCSGNTSNLNTRGIVVTGTSNTIVQNKCSSNSTVNWSIAANNSSGPIVDRTAPVSAAINGNSAPSSLGTTDPAANFTD